MTKKLFIQQAQFPDYQRPWPISVAEDGKVLAGRPDAHHLLGFQQGEVQELVLFMKDFAEDPDKAIGLIPVFSGVKGEPGIFSVGPVVESAWASQQDDKTANQRVAEGDI